MLEQLGSSLRKGAENFGVSRSSIDRIRKNKGEVRQAVEVLVSNRKRVKVEAKYEEIEKLVVEFLSLAREQGETVTDPMLR